MTPSDKINAFLPIFNWTWWQVFLFTLVFGWLVIRLIKGLEPLGWERPFKKGGREIWWSGFYGDIFLPVGIASAIVTLRNFDGRHAFYTSVWWHILGILFGYLIILVLELKNKDARKRLLVPSKFYHTFISFPFLFYLVFVTTIPMFVSHKPTWALALAFFGYGVWDFTYLHDVVRPPNPTKTH